MANEMNIAFATITYGYLDPECMRAVRRSIMCAARNGTTWMGEASYDRHPYGAARNMCVESVLQSDKPIDGMLWMDSDIVPEENSVWRLLALVERDSLDFASGLYHHRRGNHGPVIYQYRDKEDSFSQWQYYDPDVILPAHGCGFGFVYTSVKLLKAIEALPGFDKDGGAWFPDRREGYGKFGEDLGFCKQAILAGAKLIVDTGNIVRHAGETKYIGREDFLSALTKDGKEPKLVKGA